jgi:putative transposase
MAGAKTAEVCRQHGISEPTFHHWKAKYGGSGGRTRGGVQRTIPGSAEKLLAESMLAVAALKDLLARS